MYGGSQWSYSKTSLILTTVIPGADKLGTVDIERNDSGLGSETGGRPASKVVVVRRRSQDPDQDLTCLDCDQILELDR